MFLHLLLEHLDGFLQFSIEFPLFLAHRSSGNIPWMLWVAASPKEGKQAFLLHQPLERRRHFEDPFFFVLPKNNIDNVAGDFAELLADCFRQCSVCCGKLRT